jgi:hypothetical protein
MHSWVKNKAGCLNYRKPVLKFSLLKFFAIVVYVVEGTHVRQTRKKKPRMATEYFIVLYAHNGNITGFELKVQD